jgi:CHAD domain-containing protein
MSHEPASSPLPLPEHLSVLVEQRLGKLSHSLHASRRERSAEAVHDLRVASRRLRAFGVTFRGVLGDKRGGRLDQELRRVTRAVGALRDLDVQLELLEARTKAASDELERAALEHLLEQQAERRATVIRKAEKRLNKLDLGTLGRRVRRAVRTVIAELASVQGQRDYVRALLERLIADAGEQEPPADGAEHPERLHQLRIDCKEIRYALELFEPVLGANFQPLYERATTLQNVLGAYHDLVTLDEVVAERGRELERKGHHALGTGAERARDALLGQRRAILERFQSRGFDPSWWRTRLNDALAPSDAP